MQMFRTPEDTYRAYERFLRRREFKKAYRCLENLLRQFPHDEALLVDMVNLTYSKWENYEIAKPWLLRLAKMRPYWKDYALLSRGEARKGNILQAKAYLEKARRLVKTWIPPLEKGEAKAAFSEIEDLLRLAEWKALSKREIKKGPSEKRAAVAKEGDQEEPLKKPAFEESTSLAAKPGPLSEPSAPKAPPPPRLYPIPVSFSPLQDEHRQALRNASFSTLQEIKLLIDYTHLTIQSSFDELLCLHAIKGVERYWYQIETVKKVLKYFRGRALLCDEVGLGKTIEAGMVIKEYVLRNMVRNVLILTPSSLVSQWKEEMASKFGIEFVTPEEMGNGEDLEKIWDEKYVIASLNLAKSKKHMPLVTQRFYDLVVVDEAHHLRNRRTLTWQLINQIQKRFILLLSATPLQNNLIELFNLITLLKPGQFRTEKLFRQEYLRKGSLRSPASRDKMRELLRDVMVRNTRSAIDLKLPKRFAATLRVEPTETEAKIYQGLNDYLRRNGLNRMTLHLLLREAGSSPFALRESLLQLPGEDPGKKLLIEAADSLRDVSKGVALIELLQKNPQEKKVIFTQYLRTLEYVADLLRRNEVPFVTFKGTLPSREKDLAIERFREEVPVLLSTESGGEGRNLQFCNTLINFDLPWNPMRIEQRIGRLHRIGQTRDVFVFNLAVKGTLEDYIIDVLDNKINMFEMVIGEIEPILGHLEREDDFEEIVMEIWLASTNEKELQRGFEKLGEELLQAKKRYLKTKAFDNELFGEDYEI